MTPLAALLPAPGAPPLPADRALDVFLGWVATQGLTLYPAQEEALLELFAGKHVVLATPTGSGKSLVALAQHFLSLSRGERSFYTCPIKALVNEKFFALCDALGAEHVGMLTGDAAINRDAPIVCCTAEILSNLAVRESRRFADSVVMDEFHYYGDRERGVAWQVPLLSMPETQFLLMSATLGDVTPITERLSAHTGGRAVAEVRSSQRPVPLEFSYSEDPLHDALQKLLRANQAPVYLVSFTQRTAAEQAQNLLSVDVCTREEKEALKAALVGVRFDTPFGKELRRLLLHGVGLHHAGLLPRYRRVVERLSQAGQLKVISGTDTLGVGVNVPIRTVLFTQLCKFDGEKTAVLTVRDFQQIAGRAGRKGFDDKGFVVAQAPAHVVENARLLQKRAQGKKVTLQKPPTKGYAHWDQATFERLQNGQPERLEPRFTVSFGLLIHVLQAHQEASVGGYRRLVELIGRSHTTPVAQVKLLRHTRVLFRALLDAGLLRLEKRTPTSPARALVVEGLQREFSLNHTLSVYLLELLAVLDPASPEHPVEVLSAVEAILENPEPVLWAQVDALKDAKVKELKAQGVEYEQRMEELEKIEHPKPMAELLYATFNAFAAKHPWVGKENIRPKSVARELFQTASTFNDYIKEYGLQRVEGVLLRYLSDAYKTLVQNVPEKVRTEGLEDVAAFLLATLKATDSSLLEEWEALREGRAPGFPVRPGEEPPRAARKDLAQDERALKARVRAELHRLVVLLARREWDEVVQALPEGHGLTEADVEAALQPYFTLHPTLDTTPQARRPEFTQLIPDGPRRWTVRQALLSPDGEHDFYLEGVVDLTGRPDADGALVQWVGLRGG